MLQFLAFYNYGDKKPTDSDDEVINAQCGICYYFKSKTHA